MQDLDPYRPPEATVVDSIEAKGFALASRGARFAAELLNYLFAVLTLVPWVALMLLSGSWSATDSNGDPLDVRTTATWIGFAISGVLFIALCVVQILLLRRNRWSLGKRILGIRIVRSDCTEVSFGRLLVLRILLPGAINALTGGLLSGVSLFMLADSCFIFGAQRRCLHDYMADTIVVRA
jgi:uncharacterized RDD family membrane protein YckC